MPNIQIVRENSLGLNRGIYATWTQNALSDADANTLLSEGSAVLVNYSVGDYVIPITSSRSLTQADNGNTLDCAASVVLTIPPGLSNFGCAVRPAGVQIACGSGVTINGASSTVTTTARVGAINQTNTANAYDVVGV